MLELYPVIRRALVEDRWPLTLEFPLEMQY